MFSVLKIDVEAQGQKTFRNENLVFKRTFYGYRLHEESLARTQGSAMLFAFVFAKGGRRADVIIAPHLGVLLALFSLVAISFAICIGRMDDALCWIFFLGGSVFFTAYMLHFIRKNIYYAYDKTTKRYLGNLNATIPFAIKERKTYGWIGITLLLCCEYVCALLSRRELHRVAGDEAKLKERASVIREDIAALLELERKTKAKIIAPLVHVKRKTFWPWQTRAYHAYRHREDIAIAQLQLRADMGVSPDENVEMVSSLFKQTYEQFCMWPERGKLFLFLMPDDAWPTIWGMVDGDSYDDLGILHLFDLYESMYGRLTEEETDLVCKMETVGELSALLTKVAEEGREKSKPIKKERRLNIGCWLVGMLLLCIFAYLMYKAVALFVHHIFT